jgi:hypothetical protein
MPRGTRIIEPTAFAAKVDAMRRHARRLRWPPARRKRGKPCHWTFAIAWSWSISTMTPPTSTRLTEGRAMRKRKLGLYYGTVKSVGGGQHFMAWADSREHALNLVEAALTATGPYKVLLSARLRGSLPTS